MTTVELPADDGRGSTMRKIYLSAPSIRGQIASFHWRVEPAAELYRQNHFTLHFPLTMDPSRVPSRLWWDAFLMCLHAHWLLLRPCEVHIPIRLGPAERQFWLQLLRNGADTIDAYGPRNSSLLGIEIVDTGVELPRAAISGAGYGTAFSGGKDSLLQAGLLAELTEKPLLVAVTSPLPGLNDHETARRKHVFTAIQARRDVRFVEVRSDFRETWDDSYRYKLGYRIAVNELTDTFLYTSCLVLVGAALGATRLFVASETELQENVVINGKIVQHSHFMYSAATQRALARLLSSYGIRFGSLTWPLNSMHVQELLWARYPDLCDLQYSCWQVGQDDETCSQCSDCLRIAMTALAARRDPQRMGIDLGKILAFALRWSRGKVRRNILDFALRWSRGKVRRNILALASRWSRATNNEITATLPTDLVARHFHALIFAAIRKTSLTHLAYLLTGGDIRRMLSPSTLAALGRFGVARMYARLASPPPELGVREAFCDWLDPDLRPRLIAIYYHHFPREPRDRHFAVHERSNALTARACAFLD